MKKANKNKPAAVKQLSETEQIFADFDKLCKKFGPQKPYRKVQVTSFSLEDILAGTTPLGEISFKTDYQRDYVRGGSDSANWRDMLLNTVLEGTQMGQVAICRRKNGVSSLTDGIQRTKTLLDFLRNVFCIVGVLETDKDGNKVVRALEINDYHGKKFNELPLEVQSRIKDYHLNIALYDVDSYEQEVRLFEVLNVGAQNVPARHMHWVKTKDKAIGKAILKFMASPQGLALMGRSKKIYKNKDGSENIKKIVDEYCNVASFLARCVDYRNVGEAGIVKFLDSVKEEEIDAMFKKFEKTVDTFLSMIEVGEDVAYFLLRKNSAESKSAYFKSHNTIKSLLLAAIYTFNEIDQTALISNRKNIIGDSGMEKDGEGKDICVKTGLRELFDCLIIRTKESTIVHPNPLVHDITISTTNEINRMFALNRVIDVMKGPHV